MKIRYFRVKTFGGLVTGVLLLAIWLVSATQAQTSRAATASAYIDRATA